MNDLFFQDKYYSIYMNRETQQISSIHSHNEVLIVPLLDQNTVLLTIEPSDAFNEPTLILPGGAIEAGETFEQTALRELQEEIDYTATQLNFLCELRPWSKYLAVQSFLYLARNLTPSSLPGDENYPILVEQISLHDFERLIFEGRLRDARVIAALALTRNYLQTHTE